QRVIRVIDIESKPSKRVPEGHVRNVLDPSEDGTRVHVAIKDIAPGETSRIAAGDRTQVVYILEGQDARVIHTKGGAAAERVAQRRSGVYLEPGEEARVTASGTPLKLLLVTVPKHTGKAGAVPSPAGYFFEEAQL